MLSVLCADFRYCLGGSGAGVHTVPLLAGIMWYSTALSVALSAAWAMPFVAVQQAASCWKDGIATNYGK